MDGWLLIACPVLSAGHATFAGLTGGLSSYLKNQKAARSLVSHLDSAAAKYEVARIQRFSCLPRSTICLGFRA